MRSFFLPNWSPPDDPARPLPAEGRPWPSNDNDDQDGDYDDWCLLTSACKDYSDHCDQKLSLIMMTDGDPGGDHHDDNDDQDGDYD